jgi:dihydroorotase
MQDLIGYAIKNGITLQKEGHCQFCGSGVVGGVFECHDNVHHLAEILDFSNPLYYLTRFLSVDAMALQHCEIHGKWNNHVHLTRLFLILEKNLDWDYAKTPLLSNVVNEYKKDKKEFLTPPPAKQRGKLTTSDLLLAVTPNDCVSTVRQWAKDVYVSFASHHALIVSIADVFIDRYCFGRPYKSC